MARLTVGLEHERHIVYNGMTVPAFVLFPQYTKQDPLKIQGGTVHWDNALIEYTTAPCATADALTDYYYRMTSAAATLIQSEDACNNFINWCDVKWVREIPFTSHRVSMGCETAGFYKQDAVMASEEMTALGCDPSRNAYGERPIRPEGYADTWRFGGCHINFSTDELSGVEIRNLIKAMDLTFGLYGVVVSEIPAHEQMRRQYYGRAGEYRVKDFGLEYRTLSSNNLTRIHISNLFKAVQHLVRTDAAYDAHGFEDAVVESIINNCERANAINLIKAKEFPVWARNIMTIIKEG